MCRKNQFINILLISIFGVISVTPAYAAPKFFGKALRTVNEATKTGQNTEKIRNLIRDETRENIGTKTGTKKELLQTHAVGKGTISGINGTILTIIAKDGKTYTIQTDDKTQFRRRFWGKSSLSEMSVGDMVNGIGKWMDDAHTTILARLIRNTSIQKYNGVFFGTVQSLTVTGWVMSTVNRGSQTVTVSSSTKFINRKEQAISQSDILIGHIVRVRGMWDRTASTITEVAVAKDFSLPVRPSITQTLAPTQ
jgi:hypothetical protein